MQYVVPLAIFHHYIISYMVVVIVVPVYSMQ